jgi:hypothetical protein
VGSLGSVRCSKLPPQRRRTSAHFAGTQDADG